MGESTAKSGDAARNKVKYDWAYYKCTLIQLKLKELNAAKIIAPRVFNNVVLLNIMMDLLDCFKYVC